MGKRTTTEAQREQDLQKQLVDVSDNIIFAQYFTFAGLLMFFPGLAGGTWGWYAAGALCLVISLVGAIQWWRLSRRREELRRRGIKEPDYGKPAELEGIERLLRE